MAVAVLVIDRHSAMEQGGEAGRIERSLDRDALQRLDLIQEKTPVAIRRRDQRGAGILREGKRLLDQDFGPAQQFFERGLVEPPQDQHLRTGEERGIEREAGVLRSWRRPG